MTSSLLREFAIHSTSLALRDRELRLPVHRTTHKKNERGTLVSSMDADGNVTYRIVTRTSVGDDMELQPDDVDSLGFTHQILRQFVLSSGWTHVGNDRQRV